MTEVEWLECRETSPMLALIRPNHSRRRILMLCTSCCRRASDLFRATELIAALAVAERWAEGLAGTAERKAARREAHSAVPGQRIPCAGWAVQQLLKKGPTCLADDVLPVLADARQQEARLLAGEAGVPVGGAAAHAWFAEQRAQCDLIRDVFGNPFRPVALDPAWITPTVNALARSAYEERILPSGELDPDRLAVLSDALEEAGCDNEDILSHLRGPGPHVRGCWAVDLLLGKE